MSIVNVRAALETALAAIAPAVVTAWENRPLPTVGQTTPYQIVNILLAEPDNATYGTEYHEVGYMQIRLMYPQQVGPAAAMTRAQVIRDAFYRGRTVSDSGTDVIIQRTPEILPGQNIDGRYQVTVKVRFFAFTA